ncbi:hypothetical protein [Polyangium jinanense]|uniref:Uncharacterized protein n=1 Tax=Polyangium jinanense TaxID=2829994 RepID=A0A9X3X8H9_9BACT|nr:hypothetical protein [Polyangium jinanense]MDC3985914.1 hypothetical protein [Polyangium jinanense]
MSVVEVVSSQPAGAEGMIHRVTIDGRHGLRVRVRLLANGKWHVTIEDGGQASGTSDDPLGAYRVARELAESQFHAAGVVIPWAEMENQLVAAGAFNVDVRLDFTLKEWSAIGVDVTYPELPNASDVEARLHAARFMQQAFGVGDGPWRVARVGWDDFGRRMLAFVHFGPMG